MAPWRGVIDQYREYLDLPSGIPAITLLEGDTPLIPLPSLANELGAAELYAKFEGLNPTASFKDRGMTTAISEAISRQASAVVCASTGNTAASAAAYAARAGIRCVVLLPEGKVAAGKLAGANAYDAQIVQVDGSFDQALYVARQLAERHPIGLVNSLNPFRLEGQKTAAFEICDALGAAPDWLALPVGNAGNITAYWMGFRQYTETVGHGLAHLLGVQALNAAPLVNGAPVDHPETVATAIRIGRPARGEQALQAARESGGSIRAVPDRSILEAQHDLARQGLWVEPASAAGLAGLRQEVEAGRLKLHDQRVVVVCTGHGLKDPDAPGLSAVSQQVIPPEIEALEELVLQ
jgi:threonine synthase